MSKHTYKHIKLSPELQKNLVIDDPLTITMDENTLVIENNHELTRITATSKGIKLNKSYPNSTNHWMKKTHQEYHFPGEIGLKKMVEFISNKIEVPLPLQKPSKEKVFTQPEHLVEYAVRHQRLIIAKALKESGIWEKRGKNTKNAHVPKEYWCKITENDLNNYNFCLDARRTWQKMIQSMKIKLRNQPFHVDSKFDDQKILARSDIFQDAYYQKAIELKIITEVPWGIRKWNNFSFSDLAAYTASGLTRSKHWANYASSCTAFNQTMVNHCVLTDPLRQGSPLQVKRDEFLEFLYKWPKTKAGVASLEEAFNQGMNIINILDIDPKNPKEFLDCIQIWRQVSNKERLVLNSDYQPPEVSLKDGYKYIDHTNAMEISNTYCCCFSNANQYIDEICEGNAFAIYRPKFKDNDKGSLCYFKLSRDETGKKNIWKISQHKGFGNCEPDQKYINDMKVIARILTITHPFPFRKIEQNEDKKIEDLYHLSEQFTKTYKVAKENNRYRNEEIEEACHVSNIELVLLAEGYELNNDTYEWDQLKQTDLEEYQDTDRHVTRLMSGLPAYENNEIEHDEEYDNNNEYALL